jgi:3-isopropylmalate dehydrogenase
MMLDYLGESHHANSLRQAVETCIASGQSTSDLGGELTTSQMTDAVISSLKNNLKGNEL